MGLSIQPKNGKNSPVLICDTCGQQIEDWESAIVTFPNPLKEDAVAISGIYHKVKCDPKHLGDRTPAASCWMQLIEYLPWLLWNHKFGKRVVAENKRQLVIDVPIPTDL